MWVDVDLIIEWMKYVTKLLTPLVLIFAPIVLIWEFFRWRFNRLQVKKSDAIQIDDSKDSSND